VTVVEHMQKTDEEWKKQLTPEQYEVCRRKGTELLFQENIIILRKKEYTDVYTVVMSYSVQMCCFFNFLYCEMPSAAKLHPFTITSVVDGLTGIIL
jgi:hypothetical protein